MAFYLSPLVDVNEIDLTTTIPAVATSIGVIALRNTYKGAENKQVFISTEDELVREFGEPDSDSYIDMLSAMGYLKYGNKLYATRVAPEDATFAGITIGNIDDVVVSDGFTAVDDGFPTQTMEDLASGDPDYFGDDVVVTTAGDEYWFIASSRGEWGNNVRIAFLDYATQKSMLNGSLSSSTFVAGGSYEMFKGIDSQLASTKDFLVAVLVKDQRKNVYTLKETFNVSTDPNAVDEVGRKRYVESVINGSSSYIRVAVASSAVDVDFDTILVKDGWYDFEGGVEGTWTSESQTTALINAYGLYDNPEEIDVNIFIDSDKNEEVKRYLISLCEARKDCMAVLDVPYSLVVNNRGNEVVDLRNWRNGIAPFDGIVKDGFNENTSYASVYANWIEVYDKFNQKYHWVPASGYVAGIYARTDDVADPWWAPAGLNRAVITGVRRLAWNPNQGHRDILYSNGLNPIVSFSGQGKVIWGQKTLLDKESAFNRVNVRRLFLVLEKAIATAAKYFLFEPNDPITRNLLISMIEPFLRDVQARRGIYEYKVVCDESINTPERIDRNELWCNIFIKPTRTAEFIVLNFIATKTGASFDELAGIVG